MSVFSNRVDRSIGQTIDPTRGSGAEPDCTHLVAKDLLSYDFTYITESLGRIPAHVNAPSGNALFLYYNNFHRMLF